MISIKINQKDVQDNKIVQKERQKKNPQGEGDGRAM